MFVTVIGKTVHADSKMGKWCIVCVWVFFTQQQYQHKYHNDIVYIQEYNARYNVMCAQTHTLTHTNHTRPTNNVNKSIFLGDGARFFLFCFTLFLRWMFAFKFTLAYAISLYIVGEWEATVLQATINAHIHTHISTKRVQF